MSFEKMILVRESPRFKGPTKWILMCIALREGGNGRAAWPSVETIARDAGVTKRTVTRVICSLEHNGVLKVTRRANKTSKYTVEVSACQGVSESHPRGVTVSPLEVSESHPEYTRECTSESTPAGRPARVVDMKAEEITKALQDEPTLNDREMVDKLDLMGQTLDNMTKVWRGTCAKHHEMYIPEFTKQEMGQFTHFLKRAPQGRQLSVMAYALRHWDRFIVQLSREFGWSKLPIKPRLGHLLKGVSVAATMLHDMPEDERGGLNENKGSQFYSDF